MATMGTISDNQSLKLKKMATIQDNMLPSEYTRTKTKRIDEVSEGQNTNAGPACYKIGHIVGN